MSRATSTRSSYTGIRTCSATSRAQTADAVVTNWEQIKKAEKGHASLVEGITSGLPSLLYAQKLFRKAASVGLTPELSGVAELAGTGVDDERALGDALAALAAAGARAGHRRRIRAGGLGAPLQGPLRAHGATGGRRGIRPCAAPTGRSSNACGGRRAPSRSTRADFAGVRMAEWLPFSSSSSSSGSSSSSSA